MIRFLPDETVRYSINTSENNEIMCKFQIDGTCPNPMFIDKQERYSAFATTIARFHFPLIMSEDLPSKGVIFGNRMESLIAGVTNEGTVPTGMRIVFKANGSLTNPKLVNVSTQEAFVINKSLIDGEEIEVNTNSGERNVRGRIGNAEFTNYFKYRALDSSWLQLEIGENLFRYDADSGLDNLEVFVYFNNKFMEVQECY